MFIRQFRWHGARGNFAKILCHEVGGIVDIDETCAEDVAPTLVAVGLLGNGGVGLKA